MALSKIKVYAFVGRTEVVLFGEQYLQHMSPEFIKGLVVDGSVEISRNLSTYFDWRSYSPNVSFPLYLPCNPLVIKYTDNATGETILKNRCTYLVNCPATKAARLKKLLRLQKTLSAHEFDFKSSFAPLWLKIRKQKHKRLIRRSVNR